MKRRGGPAREGYLEFLALKARLEIQARRRPRWWQRAGAWLRARLALIKRQKP